MSEHLPDLEEEITTRSDEELKEPPMFKVLLHNDHYTTMEFVVRILEHVFHKSTEEATRIMLNVHNQGIGICGVYPFEIAETKVDTVHALAREHGYPLRCSLEEE